MLISTLIYELQQAELVHGDLDVEIQEHSTVCYDRINLVPEGDGPDKVLKLRAWPY